MCGDIVRPIGCLNLNVLGRRVKVRDTKCLNLDVLGREDLRHVWTFPVYRTAPGMLENRTQ
jgi:hypothetical protein